VLASLTRWRYAPPWTLIFPGKSRAYQEDGGAGEPLTLKRQDRAAGLQGVQETGSLLFHDQDVPTGHFASYDRMMED
jgi:hypothetical protein